MNPARNLYGFKSPGLWTEEEQDSATKTISHWLKHDRWYFKDALLLILGLVPNVSEFFEVEEDGYKLFFIQGWQTIYGEQFRIENAQTRLPSLLKLASERKESKSEDQESIVPGFLNKDAYALNLVAEFRKAQSIWLGGNHSESNSINYFLEWAKSKDIDIPWLDWASERHIYVPSTNFSAPVLKANALHAMGKQTTTLDEVSILLLRKIVEASYGLTAGVKAIKFRADNHQYRSTIDSLVRARFIVERNEKYFVTLIALPEIGFETPQIVDLLSWCERLFKFMRQACLDNPGEEIKVSELVKQTALTNQQLATCISFMAEASILGGWTTDLYASNAFVKPAERLLDYKFFAQVIEEQRGLALKTGTETNSASHPLAFPLLIRLGDAGDFSHLLHPKIIEHALPKYQVGHLRNAVLDSVIAIFDFIRQKTGLSEDGDALIRKAFSLAKPYLILSELKTESGQNDQKGFIQIFQGVFQGVRNPKAHSLTSDLTEVEAAQYLVLASLLIRRVEEALLVEQSDIETESK